MKVNLRDNSLNCSNSGVLLRHIILTNKLGKIIVENFANHIESECKLFV